MCDSDAFANIGIKLIFGMSKDVVYSNLLGMNNTIIRLKAFLRFHDMRHIHKNHFESICR